MAKNKDAKHYGLNNPEQQSTKRINTNKASTTPHSLEHLPASAARHLRRNRLACHSPLRAVPVAIKTQNGHEKGGDFREPSFVWAYRRKKKIGNQKRFNASFIQLLAITGNTLEHWWRQKDPSSQLNSAVLRSTVHYKPLAKRTSYFKPFRLRPFYFMSTTDFLAIFDILSKINYNLKKKDPKYNLSWTSFSTFRPALLVNCLF